MTRSYPVIASDPSTYLGVPPTALFRTMEALAASGETHLIGWKYLTEREDGVTYRVGYMVVTRDGIHHYGMDGIATQSSVLHALPCEVSVG